MWKVYHNNADNNDDDADCQIVIRKAHVSLWLRLAKNDIKYFKVSHTWETINRWIQNIFKYWVFSVEDKIVWLVLHFCELELCTDFLLLLPCNLQVSYQTSFVIDIQIPVANLKLKVLKQRRDIAFQKLPSHIHNLGLFTLCYSVFSNFWPLRL